MHCGRFIVPPLTRREMLLRCANGFGAVALAALMAEEAAAEAKAAAGAGMAMPFLLTAISHVPIDGG